MEFGSSGEAFGASKAPAGHLFGFKVFALRTESQPQRVFISAVVCCASSSSGELCVPLLSEQACPVFTFNRPEIVWKLTLYLCMLHKECIFLSCCHCDRVISIENDEFDGSISLALDFFICYIVPCCVSHVLALCCCTQNKALYEECGLNLC